MWNKFIFKYSNYRISRAGKSSLINVLSKKLISLESPEPKSITKGITEYIIYRKEQNNNKKVRIKLIDTPGLAKIEEKGKDIIDTIQIFKIIF